MKQGRGWFETGCTTAVLLNSIWSQLKPFEVYCFVVLNTFVTRISYWPPFRQQSLCSHHNCSPSVLWCSSSTGEEKAGPASATQCDSFWKPLCDPDKLHCLKDCFEQSEPPWCRAWSNLWGRIPWWFCKH